LRPHLRDDEQLLWQGAPDPLVRFSRTDAVLLYLAVAYVAGLALWFAFAPRISGSAAYALGALLVAQWLYWPAGRIFYRRYSKSRTTYAVTTARALIVGPPRSREKPLPDQPAKILRRDSGHVTLSVGTSVPRQPLLVFEDVADAEALLAALAQAGVQVTP
jgi:hypothetical protein